jgi:myo-inositol 2-dehydrogenase / D-chiro-inositol 1-dehydrogenase
VLFRSHNLDIMNWVFQGPPVKAMGVGGRQQRTAREAGCIFDHFAVEYEWGNGARVTSLCRQQNTLDPSRPLSGRVSEWVVGTKGKSNCAREIWGEQPFRSDKSVNPYVQEHADLLAAIRDSRPINDAKAVAESTLTAILGRLACYTGRELNYNWVLNQSKLDLMPGKIEMGPLAVPAVPVPGEVELI